MSYRSLAVLTSLFGCCCASFGQQSYVTLNSHWNDSYTTLTLVVFAPSASGNGGITGDLGVGASAASKNGHATYPQSSFSGTWGLLATIPLSDSSSAPTFQSGGYYSFEEESTASASGTALESWPSGQWFGTGSGNALGDDGAAATYGAPPTGSSSSTGGPSKWYGYVTGDSFSEINGQWVAQMPSQASIAITTSATSGGIYTDGGAASAYATFGYLDAEFGITLYH